ncbi:MAG: hypothetical protein CMH41_10835 [Micrococcales bacterium]|nr:hypothetical protein [Micrococcales bacterium]
MSRRRSPGSHGPRVTCIGGGHGLAGTLRAMRRVSDSITAVVGVADDGGSSGRLRHEFGLLPPGDLRMALAALCGDDTWGRTWSRVVQHRFHGSGELDGHALGNLLIAALWDETGDVVAGLDWVASLLDAQGRVLPVALTPLEIVADIEGHEPSKPDEIATVHGQVAVAKTSGRVQRIRVEPTDPAACPEAVDALDDADVIVLGPGSWYTSVIAPLLVPELRTAVQRSSAKRVLVLNLVAQRGETTGFTPERYLQVLIDQFGDFPIDAVVADHRSVKNATELSGVCEDLLGAELMLRPVSSVGSGPGVHDPDLLAAAFAEISGRGRIPPWR